MGKFEEVPLKMKVEVKVFIRYINIHLMVKIARFMSTFQSAWVAVCCGAGEVKKDKRKPSCSCSRCCLSVNNLFCRREVLREKFTKNYSVLVSLLSLRFLW